MTMFTKGILMASFFVVCAGAAEYRFLMSGGGVAVSNWLVTVMDSNYINFGTPEPDAPAGVEITYPASPGTDSVFWRNRRNGWSARTCLSCAESSMTPWLARALAPGPLIPEGNPADTQLVEVDGTMRSYITTRKETSSGVLQTFSMAYLSGIGIVWLSESYQNVSSGHNSNNFSAQLRLVEYSGINIDTLWGNVLPHPTPIHAAGARLRQVLPTHAPRRFSPDEMGIFLGRMSVLKTPLRAPAPATSPVSER